MEEVTPQSESGGPTNPFECCNVKLRKALTVLGPLFIVSRVIILLSYLYIGVNTEAFLESLNHCLGITQFGLPCPCEGKMIKFDRSEVAIIHGASMVLCAKELVFIMECIPLLIGIKYEKYEFFQSWMLFACLNIFIDLIVHALLIVAIKSALLGLQLAWSLPMIICTMWIALLFMRELKWKEKRNTCLGNKGPKAKHVYDKVICVKKLNSMMSQGHGHGRPYFGVRGQFDEEAVGF